MKLLIISIRVLNKKYTNLYLEDITDLNDYRLERIVKKYLVGSSNIVSDEDEHFEVDKDLTKILDTIKETSWSTTFKNTDKTEMSFKLVNAELTSVKLKIK